MKNDAKNGFEPPASEAAPAVVEAGYRREFAAMSRALKLAAWAAERGEIPVGATILDASGKLVAVGQNYCRRRSDPTRHAEMTAIRRACRRAASDRLYGHVIYVSLEPCPMCASAIAQARFARLVYALDDPKSGGALSGPALLAGASVALPYRPPEVVAGVGRDEALGGLQKFFDALRKR